MSRATACLGAWFAAGLLACGSSDDTSQPTPTSTAPTGSNAPPDWYATTPACLPEGCGRTAVEVVVGRAHACARMADETVRCWGDDSLQQRGGSSLGAPVPIAGAGGVLGPLTGVTRVVAGEDHTCALVRGGSLRCWGSNACGQLGQPAPPSDCNSKHNTVTTGAITSSAQPLVPQGIGAISAASLSLPPRNTYALIATDDLSLLSWGSVEWDASTLPSTFKGAQARFLGFVSGPPRNFFWRPDGTAGFVIAGRSPYAPLAVSSPVRSAVANARMVLAVLQSGQIGSLAPPRAFYPCAGTERRYLPSTMGPCVDLDTTLGQRPDNPATDVYWSLDAVPSVTDAVDIGLTRPSLTGQRSEFACALRATGEVRCWGQNDAGQLGLGSVEPGPSEPHVTPTPVPDLADVADIDVGVSHSCAVTHTGRVYCWGENGPEGRLGTSSVASGASPATPLVFP